MTRTITRTCAAPDCDAPVSVALKKNGEPRANSSLTCRSSRCRMSYRRSIDRDGAEATEHRRLTNLLIGRPEDNEPRCPHFRREVLESEHVADLAISDSLAAERVGVHPAEVRRVRIVLGGDGFPSCPCADNPPTGTLRRRAWRDASIGEPFGRDLDGTIVGEHDRGDIFGVDFRGVVVNGWRDAVRRLTEEHAPDVAALLAELRAGQAAEDHARAVEYGVEEIMQEAPGALVSFVKRPTASDRPSTPKTGFASFRAAVDYASGWSEEGIGDDLVDKSRGVPVGDGWESTALPERSDLPALEREARRARAVSV